MDISNTNTKCKTKDGHLIEAGDILYTVRYNQIYKFKVKCWNNGKRADSRLGDKSDKYRRFSIHYYDIKGCGGKGVYPEKEDNAFAMIPCQTCYKDLEKAKKYIVNKLQKTIEEVLSSEPKYIKRTHD